MRLMLSVRNLQLFIRQFQLFNLLLFTDNPGGFCIVNFCFPVVFKQLSLYVMLVVADLYRDCR